MQSPIPFQDEPAMWAGVNSIREGLCNDHPLVGALL